MRTFTRSLTGLALALAVVGAACGSSSNNSASSSDAADSSKPTGSITVSAAASLNQAFTLIGKNFEAANPGTSVKFNFDSSATLVTQIEGGAPADVFASADQTNMNKLTSKGKVAGTPTVFAKNKLQIGTKPGNPKHITGLSSLPNVGVVALCAQTAPCGKYAAQALQSAHVTIPTSNITRGQNATATIGMVSQGDANAAIVYVTDVKGAGGKVSAVDIPDNQNEIAIYPIGVLKSASNNTTAQAFATYVSSPAGESVLQQYGFLAP